MELFHIEIIELKEIFEKNGYDNQFSDRCFRTFLNKSYSKTVPQHTVPKKDIYVFLPYLGKLSLSASSILEKSYAWHSFLCQFKSSFQNQKRINF